MASVLFIHKVWYESLGLMQLSAILKRKGHKTYLYMDNGNYSRLIHLMSKLKPDIVGFSLMTGQHLWALKTAEVLKNKLNEIKPLIVFGGPHPTFTPEIIEKDPVDIICRGEGEGALLNLMDSIDNKNDFSNIPNLWVKKNSKVIKNDLRPLIDNLDSLPFPDRDLFYQYSYFCDDPNKMVMASRGCPFNCSFCFNRKYKELYNTELKVVRRRSCKNVIDEIKLLKSKYRKTKFIKFHDDIFSLDRDWLCNFLETYEKEIKLPFVCYIRAGIDNEEIIKRLSKAGCICVTFGIETGDEKLRYLLLNKKVSNYQIYNTAQLLKKYKIKFYTNSIFFIPETNLSEAWETVKINQKIKPDYIVSNIFQAYPGTALSEYLLEKKMIKSNYLETMKDIYSFPIDKTNNTNIEINIYYFFFLLVKLPWLTPIIKQLVKCRPNILFLLIFKVTSGIDYWFRRNLSFIRFLREVYHNHNYK